MRFAAHYDFPVPPGQVAELFRDPDFLLAAAKEAGALTSQAEVSAGPTAAFTVTVRATMPTAGFPPSVQAFLPQGLALRQAMVWEPPAPDGSCQATIAAEVAGAGVHMSGLARAVPSNDGHCRLEFSGEVKAQLPLVGRSVEEAAIPALTKTLDAHHRTALDWLANS
ncbi:MAG: DUF2505 domain-containing protein [Bifidobacteriaceae bacterium]|jgi:hypothetical protein|nr:DUF2505 domain-containing protein [Bifidobacteriaceae bacterium]